MLLLLGQDEAILDSDLEDFDDDKARMVGHTRPCQCTVVLTQADLSGGRTTLPANLLCDC
jgi:hypothetical protein